MANKYVGLVAAGTGGHINAAKALGNYFINKGITPLYFSGQRPLDYHLFNNKNVYFLPSKSLRNRGLSNKLNSLLFNILAGLKALTILTEIRPKLMIGAGGYICGPTLLAAWFLGIPIYILEQNSVAGLTNRLLSIFATKVFTNFQQTTGLKFVKYKQVLTGNPVRQEILACNFTLKEKINSINILVIGGSLGAQEINEVIEKFISSTKPINSALKIHIHHQTGSNKTFTPTNINYNYQQFDYFEDITEQYKWADLIISRSGASTLSELRYVQHPTILIPYLFATDNHQMTNAQIFQKEENFAIYIHSGKELMQNNFEILHNIIIQNKIDRRRRKKDLSSSFTAQDIIYKECLNDL